MDKLKNKIAVVTGGSVGIDLAPAKIKLSKVETYVVSDGLGLKKNLRNFIMAMMIIMPSIVSSPTFAAGENEPQAVVKFVGYKNAQPVYCLNISNPGNEKLTITVKDQEGNVLHEEVVTGNYISKNFLLDRDELGNNTIYFVVSKNAAPVVAKVKIQAKLEK